MNPQKSRGRPRGSGRREAFAPIELGQDELRWVRLGYRLAHRETLLDWSEMPTIDYLSAGMTPAERRAALETPDKVITAWAGIGVMRWHLEQAVKLARTL